uniref:Uncharacterized protein n=1 Tax=Solanum lycopersicum TaxID=4081 RepID=A0A494G9L2_SOLLC
MAILSRTQVLQRVRSPVALTTGGVDTTTTTKRRARNQIVGKHPFSRPDGPSTPPLRAVPATLPTSATPVSSP